MGVLGTDGSSKGAGTGGGRVGMGVLGTDGSSKGARVLEALSLSGVTMIGQSNDPGTGGGRDGMGVPGAGGARGARVDEAMSGV